MKMHQSGVTLMELLIVMVIIGILVGIAYPSYRQQAIRANRTEAKVALEQRAQAWEKCFTRYMEYSHANCANLTAAALTPDGHYSVAAVGAPTATTFILQATRQGGQVADTQCGDLRLNEAGTRSIQGGTANAATCW
jgi:type IV pilus assembly protein PilE